MSMISKSTKRVDNRDVCSYIFKCTECGKVFEICTSLTEYKYKIASFTDSRSGKYHYQCSYTCYDHASLRLNKSSRISSDNYNKYIERSESMMRGQGKKILHPIKYK